MALSGKQRRYLRGLGHALRPIVQIGKEGASVSAQKACDAALSDHELIKVKVGPGAEAGRQAVADVLADAAGAEIAQVLGKTILLYRPRPKADERPRIRLP